MADEAAVDCYSCNAVFNTWRRKHRQSLNVRFFAPYRIAEPTI